jgi:hypothetical protein
MNLVNQEVYIGHSKRGDSCMRWGMAAYGKQANGWGNPAIEREMLVRICPTLLPAIKPYVSKSQFPLSLQGLKQTTYLLQIIVAFTRQVNTKLSTSRLI